MLESFMLAIYIVGAVLFWHVLSPWAYWKTYGKPPRMKVLIQIVGTALWPITVLWILFVIMVSV